MNLDNVKTENFTFKKYNSKNKNHLNLLRNIANDNLTQDFFSEWKELLFSNDDFTYGYIVEKDNDAIGLITINEIDDRNVVFSHVISPQYRGNRYSSLIKKELYDYIFKNNLLDNIICYIRCDNKNSIISMLKSKPDSIEKDIDNMFKVTYKNKYVSKDSDYNGKKR